MLNNGLFSSLFIEELKDVVKLDDAAQGRMATLAQTWRSRNSQDTESLWESFLKQALSYLEFVPPGNPTAPGVYPLFEDWGFKNCIGVLYLAPPGSDIDNTSVGSFYPAKLLAQLKERKLNWGILTNGALWRLYSTKSSRPYEDYVELPLEQALEGSDEAEYGLFEAFFHKECFLNDELGMRNDEKGRDLDSSFIIHHSKLDFFREESERILTEKIKNPFLAQVDEVLQYICNGFIFDTQKSGEEYTEEERAQIFESAVKLIYRCLFLFYAEARRLLPSDPGKADLYRRHSIRTLCREARKFRWGERRDTDQYDLWKHLKGLVDAVNGGDPEYGIMGYNGGLFDDEKERFLGQHQLRNDFLSRALYLLAFVEPYNNAPDGEYAIPYEDLEVRHLGELYENILEYTVLLADADRIRRRTKKGVEILLASQTTKKQGDTLIKKGDIYFGESALERKQTGSYYTPESLVRFLNEKTIVQPLKQKFEQDYRNRFDELLEQARKGHDAGTRRGAAQAASALVERFVEEVVLEFKVCDPAMGSGHFLVDAANQMAGLVVDLFTEIPLTDQRMMNAESGMMNKNNAKHSGHSSFIIHHSSLNYWRRRITRHCIYGVDLNPLAVNLAKLSLWLNCFASEHKLTFLDHHIRCGNSLIGIRSLDQLASIPKRKKERKKNKDQQSLLFDYNDLSSALTKAGQGIASITQIDEDDTDEQKEALDRARAKVAAIKPMADLYTSYLMDSSIRPEDYNDVFYGMAKKQTIDNPLNPYLPQIAAKVQDYQARHHFFHWPLEFPDVFPDENSSFIIPNSSFQSGFSATVGNPPWDIVKPNSQEFFTSYDPKFRSYKKQEANKVSKKLMADNPAIAGKWEEYCGGIAEQSAYFKEPLSYSALGKGDINTFKLFLEQFFALLKGLPTESSPQTTGPNNSSFILHHSSFQSGGRMGIVVPSGLYTDQGCQPLREMFFNRSRIDFLYCFENRRAIFNIHRSFKFVLFGAQKGGTTDRFKCAFMEHDPERLSLIDAKALKMSVKQVKKFSPDTLSIFEFKTQRQIDVVSNLYEKWPLLGDFSDTESWHIGFHREFHMSDDSDIFNNNSEGLPLFEGKRIWQFDSHSAGSNYYIEKDIGRKRLLRATADTGQILDYQRHRVVFRKIAASTNERTLVSSIIPSNSFTGENLTTGKDLFEPCKLLFISAIFNSFCEDFIVRMRVTTAINIYHLYQIPLPRLREKNYLFDVIISRCARLICVKCDLAGLWKSSMNSNWQSPDFWYPPSAPIDTYGPAHEQEIRKRLRDEAKMLTPKWGPHCGVHDRLPDRRDTGDRAQLRAEIDAYVAHLYGLSRDDFAYILDTFPVLKKKEEKAFGEFMSKRKCLEEYDRIKIFINA